MAELLAPDDQTARETFERILAVRIQRAPTRDALNWFFMVEHVSLEYAKDLKPGVVREMRSEKQIRPGVVNRANYNMI